MKAALALAALWALTLMLSGCGTLTKLSEVGRPPSMTPSSDPTADPAYRPITLPMPRGQHEIAEANSLWRAGSRAFFKDQRAAQVGDIITVLVNITDAAVMKNESGSNRNGTQTAAAPSLLGLQASIPHLFAQTSPGSLVNTSSTGTATGTGSIKRNETVTLRLAGVITQVLPNGNLALAARQEVRVNSELRELQVSGVIRPQDIASDNTVVHDRLAEARIAYGGRGQISDVQTPRYGQQLLDILLPF
jgi:flagellar L-ring protein precursor FlgH